MSTPCIDVRAIFIVQTRPKGAAATAWTDVAEFSEEREGESFDHAHYLREDGDTEARVVRRWA